MSSTGLAMTHLVPLAKELDENKVTPGVLGFIVFAVMAASVWLLMKSMNRHMNRVNFEQAPAPKAPAGTASPSAGAEPAKGE
ncbi:hypothetical protein SSP531S_17620 [Streptomyces spongiicola]|uniref:Uncharacterized protein n=1 Tax=Streptomyces spongiicola TaxID=1690221 RepID=A0A388SUR1_9ACTN|nr:hypothetical protein [Streptomyces spongiicola]GBQ00347.1 hypothetical protein SSP531S_17620 [Streptomyces spongiicola]